MRLIDADTLRKEVENDRDASDMPKMWYQGVEYAINHIIHAPTVEPKHGRWIETDGGDCCYKCSECGFLRDAYILDVSNYCPNCGAIMDEVTDETY